MRSTEYVANNIGISGLKYVLGSQVSILRRFVWLFAILLAFAWMIWNIHGRVTYFLSRPSAISTERRFSDKLVFPKVTICNQNPFRSSKVYRETKRPRTSASLYEAIDRYLQVLKDDTGYQLTRQEVIEKYRELLSGKNIKEFYRKVAHQKDTLIHKCIWKGQKCGPENFTEVFTNMGVCYQFKTSTDDMIVEKANVDGGLELMLFVEQFDYMRSPQSAAGALVVITDQNETEALAKEQGIGVNVGQSVAIGLQQNEVIDLPHPYGSCGTAELNNYPDDVFYTYQKCHLNCLISFITMKCGCVSVYMAGKDVSYCTLLETLQCVKPNEELFYRNNEIKTCDCPTPCHSVTYTTSLSLVQFSESFKQSLAFSSNLVPIDTVNTALKIQTWGLLNTVNSNITEHLAKIGLMLIDYTTHWDRLYATAEHVFEEVDYLMDLISEHNLTTRAMEELKAETKPDYAWRDVSLAMMRIRRTLEHTGKWVSQMIHQEDIDQMDYIMAVKSLSSITKYSYDWLDPVRNSFDGMVYTYTRYHEIIFNFSSVATSLIRSLNISGVNESVITPLSGNNSSPDSDISSMIYDMFAFNEELRNMSASFAAQHSSDMTTVWKIWQDGLEEITLDFYSDNLMKLEIYFKDLGVHESKKSPAYSAEGLVCDIGGSIGLCLGGSILTLVEVFDIFAILFASRKKSMTDSTVPETKHPS